MLATTLHHLLYGLQEFEYRSIIGKYRIDRESLWLTAICIIALNDTEKSLLIVVVFR